MPEHSIQIDQPGVYFFKGPSRAKVSVYHELVVTFYARSAAGVAFLVFHPEENPKELFDELNVVYDRLCAHAQDEDDAPVVKIFGMANDNPPLLQKLGNWLKAHKLEVAANDVGRNASRSLLIDCGSGKVGVSYADSSRKRPTDMLDTGSARSRETKGEPQAEVLILTNSNVKRTLAKQAIEEHPSWTASVPRSVDEFLKKKIFPNFAWSVVILFDDIGADDKIGRWVESVKAQFPAVEFRWSGPSMPAFAKKLTFLRQLPPLEPFLIREFKAMLTHAVFNHQIAETSDLLPFKKKRKVS